jgi:adenylate cyclase
MVGSVRTRLISLGCAAVLAAGLALLAGATGALDRAEQWTIDERFEIRGEREAPDDVVVVGVDEATLEQLDRPWPFPRTMQARLVDRIRAQDPRLIVYDIQIVTEGDPEATYALYASISRARPVVMATVETDRRGRTRIFGGDENVRAAGALPGNGLFPPDDDGTVRRYERAPNRLPSLAARAYEEIRGEPPPGAGFDGDTFWIDYAGPPGTIETLSWSDVLRGEGDLKDKVVVVGTTAPILQDVHETPGGRQMAGPEIHANAIDTLLRGVPLRSAAGAVDALLIVLLAVAIPLLALRFSLRSLLAVPVLAIAFIAAAQLAFGDGRIVAVVYPMLGLALGAGGTATAMLSTEIRQRRRMRRLFGRFVPEAVVDQVIDCTDDDLRLGGAELDATVLFCDLRGFTGFSERQGAKVVIDTLNRYLTEMSDAVLEHDGTVVAYMGDGMMAVFGAPISRPDHADMALAAATEMLETRLPRLNAWLAERIPREEFRLGIGLNSGKVMSGNVGSERRLEYTTVGDTTNVASRLQSLTKELGVPLAAAQSTRDRLRDQTALAEVGEVTIRGRTEPETVWTLTAAVATKGEVAATSEPSADPLGG